MGQETFASHSSPEVSELNSDPWRVRARLGGTPIFRELALRLPHVIDFLAENDVPPTAWTRPSADQFDLEHGDKCPAAGRPDNQGGPLNR